ncbi:uncharacterized protein FFE2_08607 [Fusarium fujikuroi]|uniref:Uncharacterized protein n=1 Tax=Fusarium fujikuroi TaxID=5127 RepID=A0A9Q9RX51_FUSFU|nr:uncharacterized protein FFE2_08607 [Fusarium fujikuroi]VTT74612.1 unnamed protein product [Fusarium fujikuroi]
MSNARNKRAVEPSQDEPGKKRGRPTKDRLNSLAPEDSMSRVQARQMLSRHPPLEYSSQEESSFYEGLVDWPRTYEWSDDDKAAVAEEWRRSDVRMASSNLDTPQYSSLSLLFKISLRLYRTTPIVLLSPIMGMRYQSVSTNPNASKWIMSKDFCMILSRLMVHPCWEEDIDSLALALRWAVIYRLDSRRKWFVGLDYPCPVIQRTLDNVESCKGRSSSNSYHEMHKAERERASDRGKSLSILSDILYKLGETVPKEATRPEADPEYDCLFGRCVLPVTKWDLDALVKVVNAMEFQPQWNYSVEDALSAWKAESSGAELPSRGKLSLIYELTHRSIFRYLRLHDRQRSPTSSPGEDDVIQNSDPFSSDDNGSPQNTRPPHHQSRRRTIVQSSSGEESDSVPRNTGALPLHCPHDSFVEDEYDTPMYPGGSDMSLNRPSHLESEDDDDGMVGNADGASLHSGGFPPHSTNESEGFRPHRSILTVSPPPQCPAFPAYASIREEEMLSELLELRKENKELRDDRRRVEHLVAERFKRQDEVIDQRIKDLMCQGREEQKKLMLDLKDELLETVKSELRQLRHGNEVPNQDSAVQSHERPSFPDVAGTLSGGATRSPDLGTSSLTPDE